MARALLGHQQKPRSRAPTNGAEPCYNSPPTSQSRSHGAARSRGLQVHGRILTIRHHQQAGASIHAVDYRTLLRELQNTSRAQSWDKLRPPPKNPAHSAPTRGNEAVLHLAILRRQGEHKRQTWIKIGIRYLCTISKDHGQCLPGRTAPPAGRPSPTTGGCCNSGKGNQFSVVPACQITSCSGDAARCLPDVKLGRHI